MRATLVKISRLAGLELRKTNQPATQPPSIRADSCLPNWIVCIRKIGYACACACAWANQSRVNNKRAEICCHCVFPSLDVFRGKFMRWRLVCWQSCERARTSEKLHLKLKFIRKATNECAANSKYLTIITVLVVCTFVNPSHSIFFSYLQSFEVRDQASSLRLAHRYYSHTNTCTLWAHALFFSLSLGGWQFIYVFIFCTLQSTPDAKKVLKRQFCVSIFTAFL